MPSPNRLRNEWTRRSALLAGRRWKHSWATGDKLKAPQPFPPSSREARSRRKPEFRKNRERVPSARIRLPIQTQAKQRAVAIALTDPPLRTSVPGDDRDLRGSANPARCTRARVLGTQPAEGRGQATRTNTVVLGVQLWGGRGRSGPRPLRGAQLAPLDRTGLQRRIHQIATPRAHETFGGRR